MAMKNKSSALAALLSKLPDPDERGMLTNIEKEIVDNVIVNIHKGGRRSLVGLVNMLVEPGKGNDIKPRYALHCLAVYVCKLKDDKRRGAFAKTLASELDVKRHKAVQGYLIRQLQVAGGKEVVGTLGTLLHDDELCEYAAQALVAIGHGAAEQLRKALPRSRGTCRLTIVQNLGVVRDARSVGALRRATGDKDREVRLSAVWALANIGRANSIDVLLKAADSQGWERIQATKACLLLAEKLLAAGKKKEAVGIYTHLRDTRSDTDEHYVREAAEKGLAIANRKARMGG